MKLLLLYGSTDGQTDKIARHIKSEAEKSGVEVSIYNAADNPPAPKGFDGVIIGSSIRDRAFQARVVAYVRTYVSELNTIPSIFFTVSSAAIGLREQGPKSWRRKGLTVLVDTFLKESGWKPLLVEHIAGAIKFTKYSWQTKAGFWLMALFSGWDRDTSIDHEYTDWEAVDAFVKVAYQQIKTRNEQISSARTFRVPSDLRMHSCYFSC
ncbi:MAG: hemG [Bacteroidetes bacterium]|nr:hemG [Bacteroidota bacterium]